MLGPRVVAPAFALAVLGSLAACGDEGARDSFGGTSLSNTSFDDELGDTSTTSGDTSTGESGEGDTTTGTTTGEPFSCELPPTTPSLALSTWTHPAAGHLAGQTATLVVQSQNTPVDAAPPLSVEIVNRDGTRTIQNDTPTGGAKPVWYLAVGDLALGENCLIVKNGAVVEHAETIIAGDPAPGVPRGDGVWKVSANHQWTCEEQPTFGNLLHVYVRDEFGQPVEGATVNLRWTDDTVYPVGPDDAAMSWEAHGQPKTLTTDSNGFADLWTPWGEGIRSPIDGKPSYLVFLVSMADGASDVATEITTGLWETDAQGCNYCPQDAVNVYGHWSYTVEFQRDPEALEVCEVGTDHAGQQSCSHWHIFHDPSRPSCTPVAP